MAHPMAGCYAVPPRSTARTTRTARIAPAVAQWRIYRLGCACSPSPHRLTSSLRAPEPPTAGAVRFAVCTRKVSVVL
jgi:hypothetical protein